MKLLLLLVALLSIVVIGVIFLDKRPLSSDPEEREENPELQTESEQDSIADINIPLETDSQFEAETPTEENPEPEADIDDVEDTPQDQDLYLEFKNEIPSKQLPWVKKNYFGRKNEITQIINCVNKEFHHLSLYGMGGAGKTSLALHVGSLFVNQFPDGQIYVDFKVDESHRLSLAEAFGKVIHCLRPDEKLPKNKESLQSLYHSILSKKRVFIIFDNVSRVNQASLLLPARNCFVCLISERLLKMPEVVSVKVDVLALEASMACLEYMSNRVGFRSKEIAKLCGNLPLALTLMGNFLSVYRNADIEENLEKFREERNKKATGPEPGLTMCTTAAFSLSYEALDSLTAMVFRKLMVFPDCFTGKAVENICDDESSEQLQKLVQLGLVNEDRNNNRYYLHEHIRQNLEQKVIVHEKFQVQKLHSKFYLDLLKIVNEFFNDGVENVESILRWFQVEWPNIKSGQAWAFENMELYEEAEKYCCEYSLFASSILRRKMDSNECLRWFEQGLQAARKLEESEAEVKHLVLLGEEYLGQRNFERSLHYLEQALVLCLQLEDKFLEKTILELKGTNYLSKGNASRAIECYEKTFELSRQLNNGSVDEPDLTENMAQAYLLAENFEQADLFFVQTLKQVDKKNKPDSYMMILKNLAEVNLRMELLQKAIDYFKQGLVQARLSKSKNDERWLLRQMAEVYIRMEAYSAAIELINEGLEICTTHKDLPEEAHFNRLLGAAYKRINKYRKSAQYYKSAARLFIKIKDRKMEGESLWHLSQVLAESGENDQAIKWCKTALDIFERIGHPETEKAREQLLMWGGITGETV